jgi:thiol:disulfide interchange protein
MPRVAELDKFDMTVLSLSDMMPAVGITDPLEDVVGRRSMMVGWGATVVVAALISGSCGADREQAQAPEPVLSSGVTSHQALDVEWEDDWDAAFVRARSEGKPVLVNFYAEWCVWCKHLESITFRDSKVADVLAGRVVPLAVDIDAVPVDLLRQHRIEAPPTILLLDVDGTELGRIPGYMPPTGFLRVVESFMPTAEEHA